MVDWKLKARKRIKIKIFPFHSNQNERNQDFCARRGLVDLSVWPGERADASHSPSTASATTSAEASGSTTRAPRKAITFSGWRRLKTLFILALDLISPILTFNCLPQLSAPTSMSQSQSESPINHAVIDSIFNVSSPPTPPRFALLTLN